MSDPIFLPREENTVNSLLVLITVRILHFVCPPLSCNVSEGRDLAFSVNCLSGA